MIKNILLCWLIIFAFTPSVSAKDTQKMHMDALSESLYNIQLGFLTNDKKMTRDSLIRFKKEVKIVLGSEEVIKELLPKEVKHKSSIALNSVKMINKNILQIEKVFAQKHIRMINRQRRSQRSFLEIQNQCFRCHNLIKNLE